MPDDDDLDDEETEYVACDECGNVFHWTNMVAVGLNDMCVECFEEMGE